jgi:hypothetical protein
LFAKFNTTGQVEIDRISSAVAISAKKIIKVQTKEGKTLSKQPTAENSKDTLSQKYFGSMKRFLYYRETVSALPGNFEPAEISW